MIECPECGDAHGELLTLPDRPVMIEELESLTDSEPIIYAAQLQLI